MDNEALFQEYAVLSRRIKAGDSSAFAEMYQKSARLIYGTCFGILRNEEDAGDAMQETYMTCYQKIGSLSNDMMFLSWLKRIAAAKSIDLYRKNHGDISYDDTIGADTEFSGDDDLESLPDAMLLKESNREILRSIMRTSLTDVQYQTILLYYYSELPVEAIAEIMQCPVGTVKTRLKYARSKIKAGVEMYEEKTGDKIKVAMAAPFLTRFFTEEARNLVLPQIDPMFLLVKAAQSAASAGSSVTGATGASAGVTGTTASGASTGVNSYAASGASTGYNGAVAGGVSTGAAGAASGGYMAAVSGAAVTKKAFFSTAAGKILACFLAMVLIVGGVFGLKALLENKQESTENSIERKIGKMIEDKIPTEVSETTVPSTTDAQIQIATVPQSSPAASIQASSVPDVSETDYSDPSEIQLNQPGVVALTELPERDQLLTLVDNFQRKYDHNDVEDRFVHNGILSCDTPPFIPFELYFDDYTYTSDYTDPKGVFANGYCSRVKLSYVEWVEENILNISEEDRARINRSENFQVIAGDQTISMPAGEYIADDGYIYYAAGFTAELTNTQFLSAYYDGETYTVYTSVYTYADAAEPGFDPVNDGFWFKYTLKLKSIDGKLYWTILAVDWAEDHDLSIFGPDYAPNT
ncbi:MAG: RNA polymerase sigma factor [Clostridiales bacterium]|nr:RNA polymerase sigma factor [Clostridiales bacterium]